MFVGQLLLTLLTRSRPSVRTERAVSWWDVAGFTLWHGLTIAVGFFGDLVRPALVGAIVVAVALFWLQLWQLWSEAKGTGRIGCATRRIGRVTRGHHFDGVPRRASGHRDGDVVIVVREAQTGEGRVSLTRFLADVLAPPSSVAE